MTDQEKFKFHVPKEGFNPGHIMAEINRAYEGINDLTDQLYNSNGVRISKERYILIKDYHRAAKQTLLAYRGGPPIGKLTDEQQMQILVMINDVLSGKRECVQFQLNRDCNGIKEVFSSKNFPFTQINQIGSEK